MEHAASPSLITLGLTADSSSDGSSFRWGLISSCMLHALVIVMAMFLRFQSEKEQPFRTIDVALISLPTQSTTPPRPAPATTKTTAPTPTQKAAPPPTSKTAPVEEPLPPLPTETASERLSESLGGAINSILVPQQRATKPSPVPAPEPTRTAVEDHPPLLDSLRLPSAPPTIARAERLQPAEPMKPLPLPEQPAQTRVSPTVQPSLKPQTPPLPTEKIKQTVKPAPAPPSLSEVTPFTKSEPTVVPPQAQETSSIEESLNRHSPTINTPVSKPTIPESSRKRTTSPPKTQASTPKISAPKLAPIPDTLKPQPHVRAQPKMSDTVKKLMEGLKSTTRTPVPPLPRTELSNATTPPIPRPPSALDQQIAKLSIPEVAPVESIKQRLQLLEVQATEGPGSSTAKTSPGKNRYLAMVEDRIDAQWIAPPLLGTNPVVVLKFHIARSGEISRIHIADSSGHAHYDSAAQRAVQAVNPLPPFPSDISDPFFDVQYRFIKD